MGNVTHTVYDGKGNIVETSTITVPDSLANADTLRERARQALTANTNYLALSNPTNAQNVAQIQRLTRECSGLIRLLLDQVDDISGT